MKVRSITLFSPGVPTNEADLARLFPLAGKLRGALEEAGYEVQTVRLATPPWPRFFEDPGEVIATAGWLDRAAPELGIDYVSLGPVEAAQGNQDGAIAASTAILAATERIFCSTIIADGHQGVNVGAALAVAKVIQANARLDPNGFGNLRFAALANVGPGSPFFPAAYGAGGEENLSFALALESADLAVEAYRDVPTLQAALEALSTTLEAHGQRLTAAVAGPAREHGARFGGLDFSLAPFPDPGNSGAGAIESLGAAPFGAMGTLAAAALTTQALQGADYPRCGFSGLMLPVLEDSVLALRAGEGSYDLHSLLLYSAVCGTGLDTVPLPGNIATETLAAILLDVAALAVRLDKPLTARLMPIPGKRGGEPTSFDFPFFANGTILDPRAPRGGALLADSPLRLRPR